MTLTALHFARIADLSLAIGLTSGVLFVSRIVPIPIPEWIGLISAFLLVVTAIFQFRLGRKYKREKANFWISGFLLLIFFTPSLGSLLYKNSGIAFPILVLSLLVVLITRFIIFLYWLFKKSKPNFRTIVLEFLLPFLLLIQLLFPAIAFVIRSIPALNFITRTFLGYLILTMIIFGFSIKLYFKLENNRRKVIKVSEKQVQRRAYEIWFQSGYLSGSDEKNWYSAELQLRQEWNFIKELTYFLSRPLDYLENRFIKSRQFSILSKISSLLEGIGVIIISLVVVGVTLYDNHQRDLRESEDRGQEAVKNYIAQIISISLEKNIEDNERLKQLSRNVTVAFWTDSNVKNSHRKQVIDTLILTGLVQSKDKASPAISLANMDLSEINLEKADLRGVNLSGAKLRGANLSEANLSRATLDGADLTGANLNKADMSNASLVETQLSRASLSSANFRAARLSFTVFREADLTLVDFRDAKLDNIDFSGNDLSDASFVGAKLLGIEFVEATLSRADLYKTELAFVNFDRAKLNDADLHGFCLIGSSFIEANFSNANFKGAVFGEADRECRAKPETGQLRTSESTTNKLTDAPLAKNEDEPGSNRSKVFSVPQTVVPSNADIRKANFSGAIGLFPQQIRAARNWESATYDSALREQLGLPIHKVWW